MLASAGYSYAELAGRIRVVLQIPEPSLSTLRAAASVARRTSGTKCRVRLTLGMPAPERVNGRAVFDSVAVEAWLAGHPWLFQRAAISQLRYAVAVGRDLDAAVETARQAGLSWREIANTLTEAGAPRSAQALHKAYRRRPTIGSPEPPATISRPEVSDSRPARRLG